MSYIGKGELATAKILERLFNTTSLSQMPLYYHITPDNDLADDHRKHLVDITLDSPRLAVEVNLKHGTKAHSKWKVYKAILEKAGYKTMTVDDYDCRHIFDSDPDDLVWDDYRDVIDSLDKAGIDPQ